MILHEQKQVIASDFYRPFFTFHVLSLASEEELCKIVYVISTVFRPETFRSDRLYPTFTETCLFVWFPKFWLVFAFPFLLNEKSVKHALPHWNRILVTRGNRVRIKPRPTKTGYHHWNQRTRFPLVTSILFQCGKACLTDFSFNRNG